MRSWLFSLMGVYACTPSADPFNGSAPPSGPPPTVFELQATAPVDGAQLTLTVTTDAAPGGAVYLGWGTPADGPCPAPLGGACLSIDEPTLLGTASTDATGVATLTLPTPTGFVGELVGIQAAWPNAGAPGTLSTVATSVVLSASGDEDDDGLTNAEEIGAGTRPFAADSDRGGTLDGQELASGTDPRDRSDDAGIETLCSNGIDDDGDGDADCRDPDCDSICPESSCFDGRDNDRDLLIDCNDPDCAPVCTESSCDDGIDNDNDGAADCEESGCSSTAACMELDCTDTLDNDGDGTTDCEDEDCWSIDCHDSVISWVTSARGSGYRQRGAGGGPQLVTPGQNGLVRVDGPTLAAPTLCAWSRDRHLGAANVDPACKLPADFLPTRAELAWVPGVGIEAPNGALWYPFRSSGVSFSSYSVNSTFTIDDLAPTEPLGRCPGGIPPVGWWQDADGDGFAVGPGGDSHGDRPVRIWACGSTQPPGTATALGDCDDHDPTWTPATVTLAPGATCGSVTAGDRDADGADALRFGGNDSNDSDGGVP